MRTYPFPQLDRFTQQFLGGSALMPMDAYRSGGEYVVRFDLPGVAPESIDVNVERTVLTVSAERKPDFGEDAKVVVRERPRGTVRRQLFLGESLDSANIDASYDAGVLTLRIPVVEQAKARQITVRGSDSGQQIGS